MAREQLPMNPLPLRFRRFELCEYGLPARGRFELAVPELYQFENLAELFGRRHRAKPL